MRSYLLVFSLLSCLLLSNCGKDKPADVDPTETVYENPLVSERDTFYIGGKLVHVDKIKKSEFDALKPTVIATDTIEDQHLLKDSAMVRRAGDTLYFKTAAKEVTLVNDNDDSGDAYAQYLYCCYIKSIDQFLVAGNYYESYDYILIDRQTGASTKLMGEPNISPDGKYMVAGNTDLVAQFTDNGLQLFKNTPTPKLVAQKILQTWGPEEMKWRDNKTIFVKANVTGEQTPDDVIIDYYKLTLDL